MDSECGSWASRHRILIGLPIVVILGVVVSSLPVMAWSWSRLNSEEREFDLFSGRERVTRYFLFRQTRCEVSETPLSRALGNGADSGEKWTYTNISHPGSAIDRKVLFRYGGVSGIGRKLAELWEDHNFDAKAREKSTRQLLRAMREGESGYAGDEYLSLMFDILESRPRQDRGITANMIPDDLADRALAKCREEAPGLATGPATRP